MRKFSREVVGDEKNPYRIAQKLFAAVDRIPWAGALEYSTISNISDYALHAGHADCGQQTLLLMTLLRLNGIPARWQSGLVYSDGELRQHARLGLALSRAVRLGADGRDLRAPDVRRSADRRLLSRRARRLPHRVQRRLQPAVRAGQQHFRSDTVDSQRGEVEWRGGNLYFDQWDYEFEAQVCSPQLAQRDRTETIKSLAGRQYEQQDYSSEPAMYVAMGSRSATLPSQMAHAASGDGSLVGRLTASDNRPLADAEITARNPETGFTRTVKADADGYYRFPFLPVGKYTSRRRKNGATLGKLADVTVSLGAATTANVTLNVINARRRSRCVGTRIVNAVDVKSTEIGDQRHARRAGAAAGGARPAVRGAARAGLDKGDATSAAAAASPSAAPRSPRTRSTSTASTSPTSTTASASPRCRTRSTRSSRSRPAATRWSSAAPPAASSTP